MITVGITGGIGSGKSVVSELFRLQGIPVFDADSEAKRLNDTSPVIRKELTTLFGKDLYAGGSLNRKQLATLIFADRQKVEAVNAIVHPVLAQHFIGWCSRHQDHPVVMIEAALLFEAGFVRYLNKVITVFAPESIRLARVVQRDYTTREAVEERMKYQMPEEEKVERSDYVIRNDGSQSLILQTATILDELLRLQEK